MDIRIDALNVGIASREHIVPAMKDGASVQFPVGNVVDLVDAAHVATLMDGAASKASLADADQMPIVDTEAANALKKTTLADLIASIFKTARVIANAQFASASFKLLNAAGTPRALSFNTTALTADRTITVPDRDLILSDAEIKLGTAVAPSSGTSIDFTSIPAGVKRITVMFSGLSVSGVDTVILQVGTSGGVVSAGYTGAFMNASSGGAAAVAGPSNGMLLFAPNAASNDYTGTFKLERMTGNFWAGAGTAGSAAAVRAHPSSGALNLGSAELTTVRVTTSGSNTFDAGTVNISWEF